MSPRGPYHQGFTTWLQSLHPPGAEVVVGSVEDVVVEHALGQFVVALRGRHLDEIESRDLVVRRSLDRDLGSPASLVEVVARLSRHGDDVSGVDHHVFGDLVDTVAIEEPRPAIRAEAAKRLSVDELQRQSQVIRAARTAGLPSGSVLSKFEFHPIVHGLEDGDPDRPEHVPAHPDVNPHCGELLRLRAALHTWRGCGGSGRRQTRRTRRTPRSPWPAHTRS